MKCLLIISGGHSITKSVVNGFNSHNWDVMVVNYKDFFNSTVNSFIKNLEFAPNRLKDLWKTPYIRLLNKNYVGIFEKENPDLVFIYNNQYLLPDTLELVRKKSKIVFILGDHPLYTPTNPYNLHLLKYADYIICPDTFWLEQIKIIGINNVYFDFFSYDPESYYPFSPSQKQRKIYNSDLVYIGTAHKTAWGYKRFLFLSHFKMFDLKAYISGDGYTNKWSKLFPELNNKIIKHDVVDNQFNNMVYNCSKIAPIELVPSLFNGIHIRVFDVLGAGIFPLCEYSKDLEILFQGLDVPLIKHYSEAEGLTRALLNDDKYRKMLIKQMRIRVEDMHNPKIVISRMLNKVF